MHLPESVVLGSRSQSHVGVSDYGDWTRFVRAADQVFFTRSFQSITGSARFVLISDYFRDLIKLQARTRALLLVMTRWLLDLSVAIPGLDAVAPNSENGGFMHNIYMVYMYLLYIYIHTYTCTYYVCIYSRTIVAVQERHLFVGGQRVTQWQMAELWKGWWMITF